MTDPSKPSARRNSPAWMASRAGTSSSGQPKSASPEPLLDPASPEPLLNPAILAEIARPPGATLAGSIYAAAEPDRLAAAERLGRAGLWIHADVILDDDLTHRGVRLPLVRTLVERGLGPLDVHLIATELDGVLDEVCAQRVDRVTF